MAISSGNDSLVIRISPPNDNGSAITQYRAVCVSNGKTVSVSSPSAPIVVSGLANDVFASCTVRAVNADGAGPVSWAWTGMPGLNYDKTTYTYCSAGGTNLALDLFRPRTTTPVPVIMSVHGGGWYSGTRTLDASLLATLFTSRGFALATVDYRLAPAVKPPQQLQDIACAVRFMRSHSGQLGIMRDKIGGMGSSAGGNLISMLGVNPPVVASTDQWPGQSDKLQAVLDEFGVAEFGPDQMKIMPELHTIFGTTDQSVIDSYAPVEYVTPGDAPFIIVHGNEDRTVPVHESRDLYALLQAAHVPATFVPIEHMDHKFQPVGGNPTPTMATVYNDEITFLTRYLK